MAKKLASSQVTITDMTDVTEAANAAKTTAESTAAHFWFDTDGAHVTHTEAGETIAGGNVLISTDGLSVRDGETTLASFKGDGVVIGQDVDKHAEVDTEGFHVYTGETAYFHAGYDSNALDEYGEPTAGPFYTLGKRIINKVFGVGAYSYAEGKDVIAGGYCSHAEGIESEATGEMATHAEGRSTIAGDYYSHAEGYESRALGNSSHAQNRGTLAAYEAQTAIGKYNANDEKDAFEIGNGTSSNNPSNAFTVDWSGNVTAAGLINKMQAGYINITPGSKTKTFNGVKYYEGSADITFDTAFDAVPSISLVPSTSIPYKMALGASNVSKTGFTIEFFRDSQTGTGIHWTAMPRTQ